MDLVNEGNTLQSFAVKAGKLEKDLGQGRGVFLFSREDIKKKFLFVNRNDLVEREKLIITE